MTIDGVFLAGMAVVPDDLSARGDRGWFVAYPGEALVNGFQIRPMFNLFNDLKRLGPYNELRAWVHHGAEREEQFAKSFGFALDCGPASGLSPSGCDMNLWLWRKDR
jgi:hypothetical protein